MKDKKCMEMLLHFCYFKIEGEKVRIEGKNMTKF